MSNYIPFLKLKQNEIYALYDLRKEAHDKLTPFFDIPRPQEINNQSVKSAVDTGIKHLNNKWNIEKEFYIDIQDIPTQFSCDNQNTYQYTLDQLNDFNYIPVTGINRHADHNKIVLSSLSNSLCNSSCIRLTKDDIEEFTFIEDELVDLYKSLSIKPIDLVLDMRFISDLEIKKRLLSSLQNFIPELLENLRFRRIILTGSSISSDFNHHSSTNTDSITERFEWTLYNEILNSSDMKITYGDYGIVSPDYTDANIPVELIQNVATPKLIYTSEDFFHMFRGGNFRTHKRKRNQYFDLAKKIVSLFEYRTSAYSIGDKFIYDKSLELGNPSSQGNWYRMLNNSHITFICKELV